MQIRLFHLPVTATDEDVRELNSFLRSHDIVDVRKEITTIDGDSCWDFCVTYQESDNEPDKEMPKQKTKIDYSKELSPATFEIFSHFRKVRKQIAEKEAIPAYVVFNDRQLAEMAKMQEMTIDSIANVSGVGKPRAEKYGKYFCEAKEELQANNDEEVFPF